MLSSRSIMDCLLRNPNVASLGLRQRKMLWHARSVVVRASVAGMHSRHGVPGQHQSPTWSYRGGGYGQGAAFEQRPRSTMMRGHGTALVSIRRRKNVHSSHPHRRPNPSMLEFSFWQSRASWSRAIVNTLRCLVGCTLGDFAMMWFLQSHYPSLSMGVVMGTSSKILPDFPCVAHKASRPERTD